MSKKPIYISDLSRLINVVIFSIVILTIFMLFSIIWGGIPMMALTEDVRKIMFMGVGGALGAVSSYLYTRYMLYEGKTENTKKQCSFIKGISSRIIVGFFFPMAVFGVLTIMSFFSIDIKQSNSSSSSNHNSSTAMSQPNYADLSDDKIFLISIFLGFIARRSLRWGERFMEEKESQAFNEVTQKVEDLGSKTVESDVKLQRDYLLTADDKLERFKEEGNALATEGVLDTLIEMKNDVSDDNKQLYLYILARHYAALKRYQEALKYLDSLILSDTNKMSKSQKEVALYNRACYKANIESFSVEEVMKDLIQASKENPEYYKKNHARVATDTDFERIANSEQFKNFIASFK